MTIYGSPSRSFMYYGPAWADLDLSPLPSVASTEEQLIQGLSAEQVAELRAYAEQLRIAVPTATDHVQRAIRVREEP